MTTEIDASSTGPATDLPATRGGARVTDARILSLRVARARRLLPSELVAQLEAAATNLARLERLGYLDHDRCAACGQPASPRELLAWDQPRERIYHRRCVP
jgi:hypothetical protein